MQVLPDLVDLGTSIALRHDKAAACNLLMNYPPPCDLNGIDASTLRAWADIAFTADADELAMAFYGHLAVMCSSSYWPPFQIGRLKLRSEDFSGAVQYLALAADLEPRFGWAWYELCRCYFQLKNPTKLAAAALGFSAADRVQLLEPHFRILTEAANYLFEQKLREEPFGIYAILLDQGCADDIVRTRHAEYFIWKQDFETAIKLLRPFWEKQKLGDWGVRALAQAYNELGDFKSAHLILGDIVRKNPRNLAFTRDYICLLCEQGLKVEATELFFQARAHLSDRAYLELQIVFLSETGEYVRLLKALSANPQTIGNAALGSLDRAIANCAYKLRDFSTALALIECRIARFGMNEHIAICRLNVASGCHNWALLGQFLAEIPSETVAQNMEVRIKFFEYYCHAGSPEKAKAALEALGPVSQLPRKFLVPVLRFYAEQGDWPSVVKIGLETLDHSFNFVEMGHLLVRAIRKTRSFAAAEQRIESVLAVRQTASLTKLRIAIREGCGRLLPSERLNLERNSEEFSPLYQRSIFRELVQDLDLPKHPVTKRIAIYYCTDAGYLAPSFVSLLSLIEANPDLVKSVDLYLLIDDPAAIALARRLVSKLAARLSIDAIHVMTREEVVGDNFSLKTAYGMFTGGQSLAEACYYRIFFAKYLKTLGRHDLALYIDSDTVVQGELNPLFQQRPDAPLLARLEVSRPEVNVAIAKHGLEPGQYFNSGVLAFDLKHQNFDTALDRTLFAVRDLRDQLVFQDQCALNIGFQGEFRTLDPRFNFFISPFDQNPSMDGAILHFLDRPKPWDPAYAGKLCRMWFLQWYRLAVHIGSDDAMTLYQLVNQA